jgi:hypothetical protein
MKQLVSKAATRCLNLMPDTDHMAQLPSPGRSE